MLKMNLLVENRTEHQQQLTEAYQSLIQAMPGTIPASCAGVCVTHLEACIKHLQPLLSQYYLIGHGGSHIWITALNEAGKPVKDRSAIITFPKTYSTSPVNHNNLNFTV